MTPCPPPRHHHGILGHVRHHAIARSTDCNPHAAGGIAKALKAGAIAAGLAGGAIGAGAGAAAAAGAWTPGWWQSPPAVGWQPGTGYAPGAYDHGVGDDGRPCPPPQDVPEPWGAAVLAVGVAGIVWVRRER